MLSRSEEVVGRSPAPENGKGAGLSLRHGVVVVVICYTAITALLLGQTYRSKSIIVTHNSKFLINIHDRAVSNVLSDDRLQDGPTISEEETGPVDDAKNSSGIRLGVPEDERGAFEEELRDSLYHSSVVLGLNYKEMLSSFKIFVYARLDHAFRALSGSTGGHESRHSDEIFFQSLYQSDFITEEAEKANIYFIPVSIRSVWDDEQVGPGRVGRFLNKYVQNLRDNFPYWQRTLGADHAIIVCHDYKDDGSRNVLELKKNVIQVSCSPLAGSQAFYPHKDLAIPPYQPVNPLLEAVAAKAKRTTLVYHYGKASRELKAMWHGEVDMVRAIEGVAVEIHNQHLASSKFCLIVAPEDIGNIAHALRFGCVPVIISDGRLYDLPFQDILNWNQFSIVLSAKKLSKLKQILQNVSEKQYTSMQYLGIEASKHMEWHSPPLDQDAFYMTLYELWLRRHAIRYIQREDL